MKKETFLKSYGIPAGLAFLFLIILLVVFRDFAFDSSKLMVNSDQLNGIGSRVLRAENAIVTEWDDSRLGGVPTIDALFADVYHPLVWIQFLTDPARAVGFKFILTIWIAFGSAMLLGRALTQNWWLGGLLGFLYAFSPQYFTYVYGGHDGKMMVFAIAPLAILSIRKIIREARLKYFIAFVLSVVWMILGSHLQLTYLFLWGAGLYALYEMFFLDAARSIKVKRIGMAAFGLAIALLISSFQIIPPYLYTTKQSVRGTDEKTNYGHAVSWSLHQEELASILLPGFIGIDVYEQDQKTGDLKGSSHVNISMKDYQKWGIQGSPFYWGHNHFKLNHDSSGALLTFLAFLCFFIPNKRRFAIFWFLGATLALSYAMGAHSPLFKLWFEILPGVKNFRAPSMSLFWFPLIMLMMAAPVLKSFKDPESKKPFFNGLFLFALLTVITLVARFQWELFLGPIGLITSIVYGLIFITVLNITDRGESISLQNFISSIKNKWNGSSLIELGLILVPFLLLGVFMLSGQNLLSDPVTAPYFKPLNTILMNFTSAKVIPGFITVVFTMVAAWFILSQRFESYKKVLLLAILATIELYTINGVFVQNTEYNKYIQPNNPVIHAIKQNSENPSHPARVLSLSRSEALGGNAFPIYKMRNADGFHDNELASYRAFRGGQNNANYMIGISDPQAPKPFLDLMNIGAVIFDTRQGTTYMPNPTAMGEAFLYGSSTVLDDAKAIDTLKAGFPYREQIILAEAPAQKGAGGIPNGKVKLVDSPKMDTQVFEVESDRNGFMLVTGNYHPYWNAKVNGKETKVYKAFGTLRAIEIPKGKSTVLMQYRSKPFHACLKVSLLGWLMLASFVGFSVWKNKKQNTPAVNAPKK